MTAVEEKDLFFRDLQDNEELMTEILGNSVDLVKRRITFHEHKNVQAICYYTDGLVNVTQIELFISDLLYKGNLLLQHSTLPTGNPLTLLKEHMLSNASFQVIKEVGQAVDGILSGVAILILDGSDEVFIIQTKGWEKRGVDEPQTEQVVRGPRDGFTESIRTNTALVRRRIRDPKLRIEQMNIGKRSKTDINIAYIEDIVKEGLVEEVKKRLRNIKIDAILESGYIEELIEDAPRSPFTTVQSTERPDKVASSLLEGRVAIFVDNTPFVLVVPSFFWQFLQASDDYYSRFMTGSFFRAIRYLAFVLSLTLTSIYVMLVSFHQEMIPTQLILTIASGREVVPFPVLLEAVLMEISFELMREAGLRMPKPVGQAVSIVGSLVIGQAAVQAGIVSPFMVIIVALTGISSFAIPNYAASFSIRLIRFPLLIAAGTLGLLGFSAMFAILAIHALTLRSFGESYLAPATPFQPKDQKDSIIRFPWWKMQARPEGVTGDEKRVGDYQFPEPPNTDPYSDEGGKSKESDQKGGDKSRRKKTRHIIKLKGEDEE
jgi:spore germination protein KA